MSMPEQSGDSFDFCVLFRVYFTGKGAMTKSKEEIIEFMTNNKAEWALRVFDSELKIIYPEYIQNAINELD